MENILTISSGPIFIALDGPRKNNASDQVNCAKLRKYVEGLSKERDIFCLISEENKGCKVGVESALDWFFRQVDHGLILEDDCVATEQTIQFAMSSVNILENRNDIFAINLTNFGEGLVGNKLNALTKYIHVWGWVTTAKNWTRYRASEFVLDREALKAWSFDKAEYKTWISNYTKVKKSKIDTWDYGVQCYMINSNLLCVVPPHNLVENNGFDENATHTKSAPKYIPKIRYSNKIHDYMPMYENYDPSCDKTVYHARLKRQNILLRVVNKLMGLISNEV